jgi:hypothetical protein
LAWAESPFRWKNVTIDIWSDPDCLAFRFTERSREMDSFSMTGCQIWKRWLSQIIIRSHYHVGVEMT